MDVVLASQGGNPEKASTHSRQDIQTRGIKITGREDYLCESYSYQETLFCSTTPFPNRCTRYSQPTERLVTLVCMTTLDNSIHAQDKSLVSV